MHTSLSAAVVLLIVVLNGTFGLHAHGQDVYVAYSGKDKNLKDTFTAAMKDSLQVRAYNVDILGIADYSGVQKAAAKLSKAKVVILLNDSTSEMFAGLTIKSEVIVVNSLRNSVKSSRGVLYILGADANSSRISSIMNRIDISSRSELEDISTKLKSSDVLVVDESSISTSEVVAIVAESQIKGAKSDDLTAEMGVGFDLDISAPKNPNAIEELGTDTDVTL